MKLLLTAALALAATTAIARPFTVDDLVALDRITDPVVSPDGRTAAFSLRETDLAANKGRYDLFLLDLSKRGARPVRFQPRPDSNETSPVFSPDGRTLYFLSTHGGSSQIWSAPAAGGEARQVTKLPVDIGGFKLAPTGDRLAIWVEADVNCPDLDCAAARARAVATGSGRTYDQLFVRHWDTWAGPTRSRLFTVGLQDGVAAGPAMLVSAGLVGDVPSKPSGGAEEIGWAPDGRTVYFALREAGRTEAQSTNLDIFAAPADGSGKPVNLTAGRPGIDTQPSVSPDGRTLAWIAMARGGYEADQEVVWLRDLATGRTRALTQGWDRSVASIAWARNSGSLLVTARDTGNVPAFRIDIATGKINKLTGPGAVSTIVPLDRGALVSMNGLNGPDDLYRLDEYGKATRLTNSAAQRLAGVDMGRAEQFSFKGANGNTVYAWLVKPANLPKGRKAPVALLIHGGPQSSFNNSWSYRWNPQVYAGAGYAALMIDFHGSAGYGQAFTDSINQDWGGKPLEDLKLGLAAALERYDWMDGDRACALGGSYGGFMTNWIAGHWPDRFKCLVTHAGIFDQRSMYYGTEELWFPEWDFGGPYYAVPQNYERWNPANAVTAWKTPTLVLHGQLDYRVPYLQGIQAFTALQRRDIPSRLVMFPDENHWILKPANSLQWHREVLGWLDKYLKQ